MQDILAAVKSADEDYVNQSEAWERSVSDANREVEGLRQARAADQKEAAALKSDLASVRRELYASLAALSLSGACWILYSCCCVDSSADTHTSQACA